MKDSYSVITSLSRSCSVLGTSHTFSYLPGEDPIRAVKELMMLPAKSVTWLGRGLSQEKGRNVSPAYSTVLIRVCQRKRTSRVYIERKGFIVRNWLTWLWRLTDLKICRVSRQVGNPGE